jgi:hypothetical protein
MMGIDMATNDTLNNEQSFMPGGPGKYRTRYDKVRDEIILDYAYENINPEAKNWKGMDWIKQAFKNRVAGTLVTSAVAEDFSAGITEAVTETAANILEIGEQVTKPVVAGAVPNLPAGDGMTTNPFEWLDSTGELKIIDDYLGSRAVLNKLHRVIPNDSLGYAGVMGKEMTRLGGYVATYSASQALGLSKLVSTMASIAIGDAQYVEQGQDNLATLVTDWLDIDEGKANNLISKGIAWMGSTDSETLLEQYFKDVTGNNIIAIGGVGVLFGMFKLGRSLFTNPEAAENVIKLLYGYNNMEKSQVRQENNNGIL